MKNTTIISIIALLTLALVMPVDKWGRVRAQDEGPQALAGGLDPSFGSGGKATISVSGKRVFANAMAIQANNKIIAVGGMDIPEDFLVARLNADGSLDTSFGSEGKVTTDFFGHTDQGTAVAIQPDGKLVAAGFASKTGTGTSFDFALARYNSDGSLDATFGSGGKVATDFFAAGDSAFSVVLQPDGKIIAGGSAARSNNNSDFALARYNSDGSLDANFGNGGKVTIDFFGRSDSVGGLAIQPDGKIIAAGYAISGSSADALDFALARLNSDGSLDSGFGNSGKTTTDFFGFVDNINSVRLSKDGAILVAGECHTGHGNSFDNFALAKYNSNGVLDTSFGNGGKVSTDFSGQADGAFAMTLQSDDKILVAGYSTSGSGPDDFALTRYNPDGSLDTSFGEGGKASTDFFGRSDEAFGIAFQSDGHIVVAGPVFQADSASSDLEMMGLARYSAGVIGTPGFTLTFEEAQVNATRGFKTPVFVLINRTGGFTGNVTITPAEIPGIIPKPNEPISTTSDRLKFKLKIKASAPVGPVTLTFVGTDDAGHSATATVTVIVQ